MAGDSVSFSANRYYADKNVGSAKPVAVSSIAGTGADAGNYSSNTSASTNAAITPTTLNCLAKLQRYLPISD
ncbi:MAG: YDG domain-containing protein [Rhodanobacter sp.]